MNSFLKLIPWFVTLTLQYAEEFVYDFNSHFSSRLAMHSGIHNPELSRAQHFVRDNLVNMVTNIWQSKDRFLKNYYKCPNLSKNEAP